MYRTQVSLTSTGTGSASNITPPSNDDVLPNFTSEADQPVAYQSIPIPNSIAELTNQSLNAA